MHQYEVIIHTPSTENGQTVFTQQTISLNLDKVSFYLKLPMQNQYVALMGDTPIPTPTEIPEEKLLEAGLIEMETTEHGKVFIRVEDIVFWSRVELGIYGIIFAGTPLGQNSISVRATQEEMLNHTNSESIIL